MALVIDLKCVEYLGGKYDRQVKLTFRGKTHETNVVHGAKRVAYFGQTFEWPIARPIVAEEVVRIQLYNHNKYLASKLIGSYTLGLQQVVQRGELRIDECLVDSNNRVLQATVNFEVHYYSPDGRVGTWAGNKVDFSNPLVINYSPDADFTNYDQVDAELAAHELGGEGGRADVPGEDTASENMLMDSMYQAKRIRPDMVEWDLHKPRDFQITVTIIEGQQLAGLDIDPVVKVDIGGDSRYTGIRQSNNCPYYNDYFVFDFRETPARLLDKMITITAYHAYGIPGRSVLRAGNVVAGKRVIGLFKCDVATVYCAPDHQFYHKWAVLLDLKDIGAGPKGYIKCDIAVGTRGETISAPKGVKESETSNIEGNLLLPAGVPMSRQRAVYSVFVYRGEDLPQTDLGVMASVQRALSNKDVAFVDAFVQVSFAGHTGRTSVKKSYHPEWNEVIRFFDMLPPLCNRIMIQIRDKEPVGDDTIATHFIELSQIMDPSGNTEGILPTFGPSWVYFYGAPRHYKLVGGNAAELNDGGGEGCAYRGRILMSISTVIEDSDAAGVCTVRRDKLTTGPLENPVRKDFLLFFTLFEASMIDKAHKDKPIYFELSMGRYGNTLDGKPLKTIFAGPNDDDNDDDDDDSDDGRGGGGGASRLLLRKQRSEEAELSSHSITTPRQLVMMDKNYGYLPVNEEKPCLYINSLFIDTTKRLYSTNLLSVLTRNLSDAVSDIKQMFLMNDDPTLISRRIKGCMQQLQTDCDLYLSHWSSLGVGVGAGKTKLDQHRRKACQTTVDRVKDAAGKLRRSTTAHNCKEKYGEVKDINRKLQHLVKDPQHALPDILLWMICDRERVAYCRFQAMDLIYSADDKLAGRMCGKRQTVFLKKPGKKGLGQSGWTMQAKLDVYMWLGEQDPSGTSTARHYLENMPRGYELVHGDSSTTNPPICVNYQDTYMFQLRAYMFQARSLIGSDSTGLSDPFARVIISNHCRTTQVIEETLCPMWDETLVIDSVLVYGLREDLLANPPIVIIEIYDYDQVGSPEFLGRVVATPRVKLEDEPYDAAQLQWLDVYRGQSRAGELLASFELLEGDPSDLPPLPPVKGRSRDGQPLYMLPSEIRPSFSKYRLEVLFRGVRELRRVQLMTVDHPRVLVDCAGQVIASQPIEDLEKNSNFDPPVEYMDIDLPDNVEYWPPISVRCVDARSFGRDTLVGSCTIDRIDQYVWQSADQQRQLAAELSPPPPLINGHAPPGQLQENNGMILHTSPSQSSFRPTFSTQLSQRGEPGIPRTRSTLADLRQVAIDIPDASSPGGEGGVAGALVGAGTRAGGVVIAATGGKEGSKEGSKAGSGGHRATPTPGTALDAMAKQNAMVVDVEEEKKERRRYKELIADLDWWSKYYMAREDALQEERDLLTKLKDDLETMLQDDEEFDIDMIDYSALNVDKLKELEAEARTRTKELEALAAKGKKKKKKKGDKKKSKKNKNVELYETGDTHLTKAQTLRAYVNRVFEWADDLSIDSDDLETVEDKKHIARPKFYGRELEGVREFGGFKSHFQTFALVRGKKVDDEEDFTRQSGLFKGTFCIYKLDDNGDDPFPTPPALLNSRGRRSTIRRPIIKPGERPPPPLKLLETMPPLRATEVKVIVYIIKATDLHPVDFNGKADPYLVLKCGSHKIIDKDNKINNELNPVFGRMFEFDMALPMASILKVEVWDYDTLSADDLIGETSIDLEDRFYSQHRATCGLQQKYELFGYNVWRDPQKPTKILEKLCKGAGLALPIYRPGSVEVAEQSFYADEFVDNEHGEHLQTREHLALEAIHHWQDIPGGCSLVHEHVETRTLYCNERPGSEQGKLEMWIDMFPKDAPLPTVTVDIKPRLPKSYELRCIIWNTDEVTLDDTNILTGEQSSDIFVKGYLKGVGEDDQQTDVHYRSLTGEGNFNWRFVFPFDYLKAEDRVVFRKKESLFDMHETEFKVPPNFTIQIWDADLVSADDFLGSVTLDLNNIPKPAKNVKKCTLKMLNKSGRVSTLNLFKNKRCKGWWPVVAREAADEETDTKGGLVLKGKVEAELWLLTQEEAEKSPVGLGREDPEGLPAPNRPDTSFLWFLNPLKSLRYILWKNFKWYIISAIVITILVIFFVLCLYSFPPAIVNRLVNL